MDKKTSLLIATSLCTVLSAAAVMAQGEAEPIVNDYEWGIGYVFDDAYKFGRYNGLEDQGPYLIGDIKAEGFAEDGRYWRSRGTNLGLKSRYLRLDFGLHRRQEYFLEYDQLPNNKDDTARTPFLGAGTSTLTLPAGFDIGTNLDSSLQSFDIETERKRLGLGASFIAKKHWTLDVAFHHEKKDGTDVVGSAMAAGIMQEIGNTTTALLPEPIDYETNMVDVTLGYAGEKAQFDLSYNMSLFDNDENSLTWENPFSPGDFGSQALAPDNQFHKLMLSGAYQLPYNSRVLGVFSYGRMTQDQTFEPYTVNPAAGGALPRNSLDGEVWLTTAKLKLASRPLRKLRLSAEYRYDERDSDTPVDTYNYVVADSPSLIGTAANRPLSYEHNQVDLMANFRINSIMSLRGGYKYDDMSRDYENAEREDTEEDTVFAKWKVRPLPEVDLALYGEYAERRGSNYKTPVEENTALRKFYLADRDRTKVGVSVDYMPIEKISVTASADYIQDEYNDSEIGLTESEEPSYTLDVSYQPRSNINTYAYYTREDIDSTQKGSATGVAAPDWKGKFNDTVDTFGVGARVTGIRGKWDAGADLVYSRFSGDINLSDYTAPGTESQFPELKTELTSLKLWTLYRYRKNVSYKLSYWYEDYSADNWAVDNLNEDSVTNMLLLGQDTLDYDTHAVGASIIYRFN